MLIKSPSPLFLLSVSYMSVIHACTPTILHTYFTLTHTSHIHVFCFYYLGLCKQMPCLFKREYLRRLNSNLFSVDKHTLHMLV